MCAHQHEPNLCALCVYTASVCVSAHSFLASTTYQHDHVLGCQMLGAPQRWHQAPRTCTDRWLPAVQLGPPSIVWQWTCLSHVNPSLLSCSNQAKNPWPAQGSDMFSAVGTSLRLNWSHFLHSGDPRKRCYLQEAEFLSFVSAMTTEATDYFVEVLRYLMI